MLKIVAAALLIVVPAAAEVQEYRVLAGGNDVGHLKVDQEGGRVTIDYDYKNNGRGPTIAETIQLDEAGYPTNWVVTGTTTFGNKVDEMFRIADGRAVWRDSTGEGSAAVEGRAYYVDQNGSPWSAGLLARALLADGDGAIDVLPGGTARIAAKGKMTFEGEAGSVETTTYEISGLDLNPTHVVLDGRGDLFAVASPTFAVIRDGYEAADERLRGYTQQLSTQRFVDIQAAAAHDYDGPVRLTNIRIFDPETGTLKGPYDVVWHGDAIASVQPVGAPATEGETLIDGAEGTLVPGMYDMHGHLSQNDALLNIAAGITSVRDMGNENDVLDGLVERIEEGTLAGPRVVRSGFIEGKSPFSSQTGELVETEKEGLEQVRWYAARGYHQVKLYNSMNPDWAAALAQEAHRLGLRVAGHVPAFSNADAMIEAGFDELTHINQVMLGWVLNEGEDTRTLLRFTAMERFATLDLQSPRVQRTLDLMAENNVAIDPTLMVHENLLLGRDGEVAPGFVDVYDHMPAAYQRSLKEAWTDASDPARNERNARAFDQILRTIAAMRAKGIFIVPGTDLGGSFAYHRELELFEDAGFTAPEVLSLATLGMARYLGQDQRLGSIDKGKLADFFLIPGDPTKDLKAIKSIAMVVADGTVYFPSEIYPHFGIRPFAAAPNVTRARTSAAAD